MNERIKELEKLSIITTQTQEISGAWDNDRPPYRYVTTTETKFSPEKFAELIVREHINLLRQEWYDLNNLPNVADESTRDIGLRVGKKGEIMVLIAKIKQHFGVEE